MPSITCPACGRTSYHPEDVRTGYCGACRCYTSADAHTQRVAEPGALLAALVRVEPARHLTTWVCRVPGCRTEQPRGYRDVANAYEYARTHLIAEHADDWDAVVIVADERARATTR